MSVRSILSPVFDYPPVVYKLIDVFPVEIVFLSEIFVRGLTNVPSDGTAHAVPIYTNTTNLTVLHLLFLIPTINPPTGGLCDKCISVCFFFRFFHFLLIPNVFFVSSSDNLTSPLPRRPTSAHVLLFFYYIIYVRYYIIGVINMYSWRVFFLKILLRLCFSFLYAHTMCS